MEGTSWEQPAADGKEPRETTGPFSGMARPGPWQVGPQGTRVASVRRRRRREAGLRAPGAPPTACVQSPAPGAAPATPLPPPTPRRPAPSAEAEARGSSVPLLCAPGKGRTGRLLAEPGTVARGDDTRAGDPAPLEDPAGARPARDV